MNQFYFIKDNKRHGPFSLEEMSQFDLNNKTLIWHEGLDNWEQASTIKELRLKDTKKYKLFFFILFFLFIIIFFSKTFLFSFSNHNNQFKNELIDKIKSDAFSTNVNFNIYVDKFFRDARFNGLKPVSSKTVIIKFSNLHQYEETSHLHAICFGMNNDEIIEIYINPFSWEKFNKPMKYVLMYRELAKDVFNVKPLKEFKEKNIMNSHISDFRSFTMDDFIESYHILFHKILIEK